MDQNYLRELVPHYLAMLILGFGSLAVLRWAVEDPQLWIELAIVLSVVFSYRPAVLILGIAPDSWQRE